MRPLPLALLLGAPLAAQATFVVDALGGPGTVPTLAAAEAVAAPGDTILVRPTATYDFGLTTAKGLTILGTGPGRTQFHGHLTVDGLPLAQRFAMRGFAGQAASPQGGMQVRRCLGAVVLEDLVLQGPQPGSTAALAALAIQDCEQVSLHRCYCLGNGLFTATMFASRIAASECTFFSLGTQVTAVSVFGGDVHLTMCQLLAPLALEVSFGNGLPTVTVAGGACNGVGLTGVAVRVLTGTVRLDAAVTLNGAVQGPTTAHECGRPALTLASPGQAGTLQFAGPAGASGALALGLPAAPLPTPIGDPWFDPQAYVVVALGALPLQASFVTPPAAPMATALVAQGLLLHQGTMALSGPVRALLP